MSETGTTASGRLLRDVLTERYVREGMTPADAGALAREAEAELVGTVFDPMERGPADV